MRSKSNRVIQVMTATENVLNQYKKRYEFFERITPDGKSVFISMKTGEQLSKKELDAIYPTPSKLIHVENCDKRRDWMHDRPSY